MKWMCRAEVNNRNGKEVKRKRSRYRAKLILMQFMGCCLESSFLLVRRSTASSQWLQSMHIHDRLALGQWQILGVAGSCNWLHRFWPHTLSICPKELTHYLSDDQPRRIPFETIRGAIMCEAALGKVGTWATTCWPSIIAWKFHCHFRLPEGTSCCYLLLAKCASLAETRVPCSISCLIIFHFKLAIDWDGLSTPFPDNPKSIINSYGLNHPIFEYFGSLNLHFWWLNNVKLNLHLVIQCKK